MSHKFDPSNFHDQVAERKRAEIFWSQAPSVKNDSPAPVSYFKVVVYLFWIAVLVKVIFLS